MRPRIATSISGSGSASSGSSEPTVTRFCSRSSRPGAFGGGMRFARAVGGPRGMESALPALARTVPIGAPAPATLCESEDVKELDVQPVRSAARELADPVLFFEAEDEGVHHVVNAVELVEPEEERGRLLPGDEEQS